jgi:hypothetical protein
MSNDIILLIEIAVSFLPYALFAFFNGKANVKKENRNRQYPMPVFAVVYSVVLLIFMTKIQSFLADKFYLLADLLEDKDLQDAMEGINDYMTSVSQGQEFPIEKLPEMLREMGDMVIQSTKGMDISFTTSVKTSKDGFETIISMLVEIDAKGMEGCVGFTVTDKIEDSKKEFVHTMSFGFELDGIFEDVINGKLSSSDNAVDIPMYDKESAHTAVTKSASLDSASFLASLLESEIEIETKWDKNDGDISITLDLGKKEMFSLEGNLQLTNSEMTFIFEKIEIAGIFDSGDYIDNVTLHITAGKPKGLSAPKFTNVLDMTEQNITDLMVELKETFEEFVFFKPSVEVVRPSVSVDNAIN